MSGTVTKTATSEALLSYLQTNVQSLAGAGTLRTAAMESFAKCGLPTNKDEEFRKTPLSKAIESFTFIDSEPKEIPLSAFAIPTLEGYPVVFTDGTFDNERSSVPDKVIVLPMQNAMESHGELIALHLGKYAGYEKDGLVAFNTAGWKNGLFVHVPAGVVLDKPIILYNVISRSSINIVV